MNDTDVLIHVTPDVERIIKIFFPAEIYDIIAEGYDLNVRAGNEAIEDVVENLIALDQYIHPQEQTDMLRMAIESGLTAAIKEFGFMIVDETPLTFKIKLLRALLSLPFYEDKAAILSQLETVIDLHEKVCNIINFVEYVELHDLDLYVESINAEFFNKVKSTCLDQTSIQEITEEDLIAKQIAITKVKHLKEASKRDDLVVVQLLRQNIVIGLPLSSYLISIIPLLSELDEASVALEVLGIMLISKEQLNTVVFNEQIQMYYSDPLKIGKITRELNLIVGKYSAELGLIHTNIQALNNSAVGVK